MNGADYYFLFISEEKDENDKFVKLGVAITSSSVIFFKN